MPLPYTRSEAKDWAKRTWSGCCNVVMPTFTEDRSALNPAAILHDLRRSAELGFWGSLLVSECGTTLEEMVEFCRLAAGNRPRPDYRLVLHGSFNDLAEVLSVARAAEEIGIEAMLVSYPPSFFPRTADDIAAYTRRLAEGTGLALILFAVPTWDFVRFHPSGFPPDVIEAITDIDTAVALKYECGQPGNAGMAEIQRRIGGKLLISDPLEQNAPGWIQAYGMPWIGTSNYEFFGDRVPRYHRLFCDGRWDEGFALYWQMQPARLAKSELMAAGRGSRLIHRAAWKYMQWLNGFSGGPLRMPQMRISARDMRNYRDSLARSGVAVTEEPDEAFFRGRFPA